MADIVPRPTDHRQHQRTVEDDVDDHIYHLRLREHLPWRAIAQQVGFDSHPSAINRFNRLMAEIRPENWEALRTEESTRLDELAYQHAQIVQAAIGVGDLKLAQDGLKEIHNLTRTRIKLWGLDRTDDEPANIDDINNLIAAYTQGVTDGQQQQEPTP